MSRDSAGNASVNRNQAVTGQTVLAEQVNVPFADIEAMLNLVFWRDGLAPMTGNLPMNGFKISGLPDPSANSDVVTLAYLNGVIAASGVPTGAVMPFRGLAAPTGWVKENGGTIGSASSGATTRANADTAALFAYLWNNIDNATLPIQTSAGTATTRGASAAADFAANKRMPLFDSRSRFLRGADDGLGFDASLTIGLNQSDAIKSHNHTGTTNEDGEHDHDSTISSGSGGSRLTGGSNNPIGTDTLSIAPSGRHAHGFTTDSTGNALETRPRSSVVLYCIKL